MNASLYPLALLASLSCLASGPALAAEPSPNGLTLPEGYRDWRVISTAHRLDNQTLRIILGNDVAIEAARSGQTNPWPDGTILSKLVWKEKVNENWSAAIAPGAFIHAEFMFKDHQRFAETGGWGYARWLGMEQKPYGKDADLAQECVACHTPVKHRDWVYTTPVQLP